MDRTRNTLLVVTTLCLAGALLVYMLIQQQQQALLEEVKENPLWAAHQLERESHDFGILLKELSAHPDDAKLVEKARLRFDILYSRLSVVSYGQLGQIFSSFPETAEEIGKVRQLMDAMDEQLSAQIDADAVTQLRDRARQLTSITGRILLDTLEYSVREKAERREKLGLLVLYLGLLIVLVAIGTMLLVFTLVRQVREVQRAHAETLAVARNLDRSVEQAQQARREQGAFLRAMSLELRSRLDPVRDASQRLLHSPLDEAQHHCVESLQTESGAMLEMLDRILDLSLLESADFMLRDEAFNLKSLLRSLAEEKTPDADARGLSLNLEVSDDAGGTYMGDAIWLKQVLSQLIDNALHFTTQGRIDIRVGAEHRTPETSELLFEVKDTGVGIDYDLQAEIFRPFVTVAPSGVPSGAGLGLAICKRCIERMQGTIGVDSSPGQGARFWFRVPLHRLASQGARTVSGGTANTSPGDA